MTTTFLDRAFSSIQRRKQSSTVDAWTNFIDNIVTPLSHEDEVDGDELESWISTVGLDAESCEHIRNDPARNESDPVRRARIRLEYLVKSQQDRTAIVSQYRQALADEKEYAQLSPIVDALRVQRAKMIDDFDAKHQGTFARHALLSNHIGHASMLESRLSGSCLDPSLLRREKVLHDELRSVQLEIQSLAERCYRYELDTAHRARLQRQLDKATAVSIEAVVSVFMRSSDSDAIKKAKELRKQIAELDNELLKCRPAVERTAQLQIRVAELTKQLHDLSQEKLQ
jgi:hypothetical protein